MIKLNGAAQREFYFGAGADLTMRYFGELSRMIAHLPHIELIEAYNSDEVRVRYSSLELGAYTISIITDLVCTVDQENKAIVIRSVKGRDDVKESVNLSSTLGYGYFTSAAYLQDAGDQTFIDFRLKIAASLPRPRGLRMMPGRVVNRIASSISQGRVNEIIEGFMANAISSFPAWLAEQELTTE
jgi:Protein of unknown function (DUF1997)